MRAPHLLALCLCVSFAACGDDAQVVFDVVDPSDSQTGDTGTSWSAQITSPVEGAVFGEGMSIPVQVELSGVEPSRAVGFRATIAIDGMVSEVHRDLPFDARGRLVQSLNAGAGAHTLAVTVTGGGESATTERAFAVNTPPGEPSVAFREPHPSSSDDLELDATPPVDPTFIGEGVTLKFRWRKVGADTNLPSSGPTLSHVHTEKGDVIEVFVRANDGFVDGPEVRREVTIVNAAPSCTGVTMSPSAVRTGQTVTCACAGWSDPDGDADESTCVFTDVTSGATLDTAGDCTLPASAFTSGMNIACTVTPHDGETAGTPVSSPAGNAIPVINSSPLAPVATLSPGSGDATTPFTCQLTTAGVDPDGDSVIHTTSWTVGGQPVEHSAASATGEHWGAKKGDALCCRIVASDGVASATSAESCVTLDNAPPPAVNVFARVRGGGVATRRSMLDCAPQDAIDPDGDPLTITYAWFVGDTAVSGAIDSSLSAADIPRDSVVSCVATICDGVACTEPIVSKNSLVIANTLPQIESVAIVPDEVESNPGDVLTCAFSGWDDPDGDAVQVVYQWVVVVGGIETVLASETSADIEVTLSIPAGAQLVCRVTPMNGADAGPTTPSAPRSIGEAIPIPPVVAVHAPQGAGGMLTCQTTTSARFIPQDATWIWRWSRNGTLIDTPSSTTLAPSHVSDCDLVRCWVEIRAPGLSIDSNQGSSLMPLGDDCDDGNACTTATCFMGGGCNQVATDGGPCDDGDACTDNEVCQAGTCVGTLDVCKEDRLSVSTAVANPTVISPQPDGGYLAIFGASMRLTDTYGSRIDEQLDGGAFHGGSISPSGRVARFRYAGNNGVCHVNNNYVCFYYTTRIHAAGLATFTDLPVQTWCGCGSARPVGGTTLALSDESFIVFMDYSGSVAMQKIDASLNRTGMGSAASGIYTGTANQALGWHAALVPDGTDSFMFVWVASNRKTIYAQRYSALGAAEFAAPLEVATTQATFDAVSVAPMANGRFVVAWQGADLDGVGQGIMAQRFDESGSALGAAFVVNEVATGDQWLGGIAAFSNLRFAVAWRDGSTPTARYMARTFSAAAAGGSQFVLNESTSVSALVPSIAAMSDDDFIASWRDGSNVLWTRRYRFDGTYSQGAAEFRANDSAANQQETPAAAASTDGNVMTVYASTVIAAGHFGTEIMTRVFDADGLEVAPERIAYDDVMQYAQTQPAVAGSAAGFTVVWNSEEQDGDGDGIFARRFDTDGTPLGGVIEVNTTTAGYQRQPVVALTTDGTWVAVWNGQSSVAGSTSDVYARIFRADGTATAEIVLNSTFANVQERPSIAMVPFGNDFVAAWQSRNQDGDGLGIYARKFGIDGVAKTIEFPVNTRTTGDQRNPTVAVSQSNQVAVCWESVGHVTAGKAAVVCQYLRTSDLLPVGGEFLPFSWSDEQSSPTARFQANGHLAVAFQTLGLDSASYAIQLVRVNNLGVFSGARLNTNRMWAEAQTRPFVVPLDDRLFVGWQSHLQDGSQGGIFFRILPQP